MGSKVITSGSFISSSPTFIRFTSYLGQGSNELATSKPFYLKPTGLIEDAALSDKAAKNREAALKRLDPLTTMRDQMGR